jgi:hypothetical protein
MKTRIKHGFSAIVIAFFFFLALSSSNDSSDSTTDLNASISFTGAQFVITNNDSFDYINAKFEVNDDYVLEGYTIKAGETYTVGMMQFADDDGNRFDMMKKPLRFSIWCDLSDGKHGFYYATWQ